MIFIIIGAASVVFADLFVLAHSSRPDPAWWSHNVFTVLSAMRDEGPYVDVAALKSQNAHYLENGIAIPLDNDITSLHSVITFPEQSLSQIEPSAGVEGPRSYPHSEPVEEEALAVGLERLGLEEEDIAQIYARGRVEDVILAFGELPDVKKRAQSYDLSDTKEETEEAVEIEPAPLALPEPEKAVPLAHDIAEEGAYEVYTHAPIEVEEDHILPNMPDRSAKYRYVAPDGGGRIAIIIDDMGLSLRSKQLEAMDAGLTLSYLPYSKKLADHAARALANGHDVMLHMPMEPLNDHLDPGPHTLKVLQDQIDFKSNMNWNFTQFDGYTGVNNHMGSRLTMDKGAMDKVMAEIKARQLFFIDSRTINDSVAVKAAREAGVPYAVRDIFLDHEVDPDFINGALKRLEDRARNKGYAIAIGHPHKETVRALKEWLPTLEEKGLTLVPVSALLMRPVPINLEANLN